MHKQTTKNVCTLKDCINKDNKNDLSWTEVMRNSSYDAFFILGVFVNRNKVTNDIICLDAFNLEFADDLLINI